MEAWCKLKRPEIFMLSCFINHKFSNKIKQKKNLATTSHTPHTNLKKTIM